MYVEINIYIGFDQGLWNGKRVMQRDIGGIGCLYIQLTRLLVFRVLLYFIIESGDEVDNLVVIYSIVQVFVFLGQKFCINVSS